MLLTPTEMERLTIFTAAELARKRKAKGLQLNHPEAIAYIADEILEGAREGKTVAEMISFGSTLLSTDDVMPGVADLIPMIQVEGMFPDGTKLVTVHDPIRPGNMQKPDGAVNPGELVVDDEWRAAEQAKAAADSGDNLGEFEASELDGLSNDEVVSLAEDAADRDEYWRASQILMEHYRRTGVVDDSSDVSSFSGQAKVLNTLASKLMGK